MPQRRSWKPPKQDHSVYVQQLFKDFLKRNHGKQTAVVPGDSRTNFVQTETTVRQRKQPGIFDRAVYARFERDANGAGFKRQAPSTGFKTGLMKWIDQQRNHRQQQHTVLQKTTRSDDYVNLPDNFFSGVEQMKMPIEVADRTLGNVTNNFVPPATSTPFERLASFGISGVLSDPDEFQPTAPDGSIQSEWQCFLKSVDKYLIHVTQDDHETSLVDKQRKELFDLLQDSSNNAQHLSQINPAKQPTLTTQRANDVPKSQGIENDPFGRPSWRDHSLISNQQYCPHRSPNLDITVSPPATFHRPVPNLPEDSREKNVRKNLESINRTNVTFLIEPFTESPCSLDTPQDDILLSASPPSPTLPSSPRDTLFDGRTFLLDQTRTEDTLMAKLDALLEEDDFSNEDDGLINFDFNFASQRNQTAMNITFPNHSRIAANFLDESLPLGKDRTDTNMYLSQEVTNLF
ncbi:AGAP013302-PA-like protein [Anopheles sinensis]|uniref:AGAP013302-PA-like protein n=1 Tax=Anopheles sinensis TaxID=74873 RepID=A0A084W7Z3_ANOSI|nr:AGAP013302-PA-like protein [Anopheles sinensis]